MDVLCSHRIPQSPESHRVGHRCKCSGHTCTSKTLSDVCIAGPRKGSVAYAGNSHAPGACAANRGATCWAAAAASPRTAGRRSARRPGLAGACLCPQPRPAQRGERQPKSCSFRLSPLQAPLAKLQMLSLLIRIAAYRASGNVSDLSVSAIACAECACGAMQMEVDFEAVTNSGQPAGGPLNAAMAPLFAQMMQAMSGQAPPPHQPTQACHTADAAIMPCLQMPHQDALTSGFRGSCDTVRQEHTSFVLVAVVGAKGCRLGQGMSVTENSDIDLNPSKIRRLMLKPCLYRQTCICQLLQQAQGHFLGQGLIGSTAKGPSAVARYRATKEGSLMQSVSPCQHQRPQQSSLSLATKIQEAPR